MPAHKARHTALMMMDEIESEHHSFDEQQIGSPSVKEEDDEVLTTYQDQPLSAVSVKSPAEEVHDLNKHGIPAEMQPMHMQTIKSEDDDGLSHSIPSSKEESELDQSQPPSKKTQSMQAKREAFQKGKKPTLVEKGSLDLAPGVVRDVM